MNRNPARKTTSVRETLGGNEVSQIFLHDPVVFKYGSKRTYTAPGYNKYLERTLLIAREQDLVCVRDPVSSSYLTFLAGLEIRPNSENIVPIGDRNPPSEDISFATSLIGNPKKLDEICKKIPFDCHPVLNPYIATPDVFLLKSVLQHKLGREVSVSTGDADIVFRCIQKHWVKEKARRLGIPVAEGALIELELTQEGKPADLRPIKEAVLRQLEIGPAVIIRCAVGTLPAPIIQINDGLEDVEKALRQISQIHHISLFLVEVMYDVTVSPNIVMFIEAEKGPIHLLGITDQRLNVDLAHRGNLYPSNARTMDDMLNSAYRFSSWLQTKGFYGIIGYDFCEYVNREDGVLSYFLAEINPRINGSVYPLSLFANLVERQPTVGQEEIRSFLSAKLLKVHAENFHAFKRKFGEFLYSTEKQVGMVPYNLGNLERGMVDIVVVGSSPGKVRHLFEKIQSVFATS